MCLLEKIVVNCELNSEKMESIRENGEVSGVEELKDAIEEQVHARMRRSKDVGPIRILIP